MHLPGNNEFDDSHIHIWDPNTVIIVPTDALVPMVLGNQEAQVWLKGQTNISLKFQGYYHLEYIFIDRTTRF